MESTAARTGDVDTQSGTMPARDGIVPIQADALQAIFSRKILYETSA